MSRKPVLRLARRVAYSVALADASGDPDEMDRATRHAGIVAGYVAPRWRGIYGREFRRTVASVARRLA